MAIYVTECGNCSEEYCGDCNINDFVNCRWCEDECCELCIKEHEKNCDDNYEDNYDNQSDNLKKWLIQ